MMRQFHIRRATLADLDQVVDLRRKGVLAAFSEAGASQETLDELVEEIADRHQASLDLQDPNCFVLVAMDGDVPVGTAALRIQNTEGHLFGCFCALRGRGVGSALMEARLEIARSLELENLWLEADTINAAGTAHALRHSFKAVKSRPGKRLRGNSVVRFERRLSKG